jgi:hypothetical protein
MAQRLLNFSFRLFSKKVQKGVRTMKKILRLSMVLFLAFFMAFVVVDRSQALPYTKGDVFADAGAGLIYEFTPTGTLVQTLNTTHVGEGDGMAFDNNGNLYATSGFAANTVVKFDSNGNLLTANFGTGIPGGYNSHPESVVVDNTNSVVYIGQPDGNHQVLKLDLNGNYLGSFNVGTQNRGTDWIDLQADLHTLRYTSEGTTVFRYDLATSTQLTAFNSVGLPNGPAYAHRILSDGGELVAATSAILKLNSAGTVVNNWTIPNTSLLFAINLDPNGTSFWTADYLNGEIYHLDLATGTVINHFNGFIPGQAHGVLGGLAVFGEITQSNVPEPATMLLLGCGLLGLVGYGRRKIFKK